MKRTVAEALVSMTDRCFRFKEELDGMREMYQRAAGKAARRELDLQSAQRGIRRLRARTNRLEAHLEKYQLWEQYKADQKTEAAEQAEEWFKDHPEDRPVKKDAGLASQEKEENPLAPIGQAILDSASQETQDED